MTILSARVFSGGEDPRVIVMVDGLPAAVVRVTVQGGGVEVADPVVVDQRCYATPIDTKQVVAMIDSAIADCERTASQFPVGSPMRYGRNGGVEALLSLRAQFERN